MRDTIDYLKRAINRANNSGPFGCYHIRDGTMYAQNDQMQAAAPVEITDNFSVPGEELEAAFSRMKSEPRLTLVDGHLIIQSGRLKSTIPIALSSMPDLYDHDGLGWTESPPALAPAIAASIPFLIGNQTGWTAGIRLMDSRLTCMNNRCGIDVAIPGWTSPPSLITKDCAEFLVTNPPDEYAAKQGALVFRWADGRVMQAQLIDQQMPAAVDNIFAKGGTDYPVEISTDWRLAYEEIASLADSIIEIRPDLLCVGRGSSKITIEVETPVPEGHRSFWETKVLSPMVAVASHWNPGAYPGIAAFTGPSLYGVVSGIKQ